MKSYKVSKSSRVSKGTQTDIKQDLAVVKMIFEMYATGFEAKKISEWVNDVKSSKANNVKCDSKTVFDILIDESYKSYKEGNGHNGLISNDIWDKVQKLLCASDMSCD